ncbi:MAG: tetraacyldisaccharide 4'-kinase, partial [Gammaproteobacteria bacterium]
TFVVVKAGATIPADIPNDALIMQLELTEAVSLTDGNHHSLTDFAGQRVHAVAGIADPEQFFRALGARGLQVDGRSLPDHAVPDISDVTFDDALPVFMTEKDAVKCQAMKLENHWYVTATARFSESDQARFMAGLSQRLAKSDAYGVQHHG